MNPGDRARAGGGALRTIELRAIPGIHRDGVAIVRALVAVVEGAGSAQAGGQEPEGQGEQQQRSSHRSLLSQGRLRREAYSNRRLLLPFRGDRPSSRGRETR